MIRLCSPRKNIRQIELCRPIIQLQEASPIGGGHTETQRRGGNDRFVMTVAIHIEHSKIDPSPLTSADMGGPIKPDLGRNEVAISLMPQVAEIETAKQPMPVDVISLRSP